MKKILFAIAIVMMMVVSANAQGRDGFFSWNDFDNEFDRDITTGSAPGFVIPGYHGLDTNPNAPLGSGLIILSALGAGYAFARKHKKE